jgi:hypothetical protein
MMISGLVRYHHIEISGSQPAPEHPPERSVYAKAQASSVQITETDEFA